MVCTHALGVWKLLRLGVGADKITAAFCVRCPNCMVKPPMNKENECGKIHTDDDDDELYRVEESARRKWR